MDKDGRLIRNKDNIMPDKAIRGNGEPVHATWLGRDNKGGEETPTDRSRGTSLGRKRQ